MPLLPWFQLLLEIGWKTFCRVEVKGGVGVRQRCKVGAGVLVFAA